MRAHGGEVDELWRLLNMTSVLLARIRRVLPGPTNAGGGRREEIFISIGLHEVLTRFCYTLPTPSIDVSVRNRRLRAGSLTSAGPLSTSAVVATRGRRARRRFLTTVGRRVDMSATTDIVQPRHDTVTQASSLTGSE
jgi:hypothetical protein